jgi:hypothetical protein
MNVMVKIDCVLTASANHKRLREELVNSGII